MILILGILVIFVEVGTILFGNKKTEDSVTASQIIPLPGDFDVDLIARIKDREKYLLLNREQFLGNAPVTTVTPEPSLNTTPSVTVSPSATVTPTTSVTVSTTPSP